MGHFGKVLSREETQSGLSSKDQHFSSLKSGPEEGELRVFCKSTNEM